MAYQGMCWEASSAVVASRAISVAASKPRPKNDPDRVQPFLGDDSHPPAEEPVEEAAAGQLALQLGLIVGAAAHRGEDPHDPGQDDQVQQPDEEQEGRGDRLFRDDDADPDRDHDGGMPEGEEEAEPERARLAGALTFAQHLASGVVDRGVVVGVEGVPQAQGVGQDGDADPPAPCNGTATRTRR
jgi:hypothetical protein